MVFQIEIHPGSGFYMLPADIAILEVRADRDDQATIPGWKKLIAYVLEYFYGCKIVEYCAVGDRSNSTRPGIDARLYKGLYGNYVYYVY